MSHPPSLLVLLPSLRISGGVAETLRLCGELQSYGIRVQVVSFWKHAHELDTTGLSIAYMLDSTPQRSKALKQLPLLAFRFFRFVRQWRHNQPENTWMLLTHFTTFFFAWLFPGMPRVCFNQDQEWLFVQAGLKRELLKRVILFTSRNSTVITTSRFISEQFERHGVRVFGEASVWADPQWLAKDLSSDRTVNVTMLLRLSPFKRLDLHIELLKMLRFEPDIRVTVVTPEDIIASMVQGLAGDVLLRPSDGALKELFASTRLFVLLSDVEGFGLPPLEAMGSGAVPLCRDSGGVRNYMQGVFASLLVPKAERMEAVRDRILSLLQDACGPSPEQAREAFGKGLLLSRQTRAETVNRLSVLLRVGKQL